MRLILQAGENKIDCVISREESVVKILTSIAKIVERHGIDKGFGIVALSFAEAAAKTKEMLAS